MSSLQCSAVVNGLSDFSAINRNIYVDKVCCFRRGRFSKVQVGPIHFCVFFSYLQIFFRFFFLLLQHSFFFVLIFGEGCVEMFINCMF